MITPDRCRGVWISPLLAGRRRQHPRTPLEIKVGNTAKVRLRCDRSRYKREGSRLLVVAEAAEQVDAVAVEGPGVVAVAVGRPHLGAPTAAMTTTVAAATSPWRWRRRQREGGGTERLSATATSKSGGIYGGDGDDGGDDGDYDDGGDGDNAGGDGDGGDGGEGDVGNDNDGCGGEGCGEGRRGDDGVDCGDTFCDDGGDAGDNDEGGDGGCGGDNPCGELDQDWGALKRDASVRCERPWSGLHRLWDRFR